MERKLQDFDTKPDWIKKQIEGKNEDINRKKEIINAYGTGQAQGDNNNTNINIIKNKIKTDVQKKERESLNSINAIRKYESEINNLNISIKKLQDDRRNQNIEQKIRDTNEQIVKKMALQEQIQNELQLDVNQR